MKINTKFFGEFEFDEQEMILFPYGIYGFEENNRYILIYDDEEEAGMQTFMWLQSVDDENLCFIVLDPKLVKSDYDPCIPHNVLNKLGANGYDELRYIVLAVIYDELADSTVNLLSPIVINMKKNIAMQVVLDNSEPKNSSYKTKHSIFEKINASVQTDGEV